MSSIHQLKNNKEIKRVKTSRITYWFTGNLFDKDVTFYCWKKDWQKINTRLWKVFYL